MDQLHKSKSPWVMVLAVICSLAAGLVLTMLTSQVLRGPSVSSLAGTGMYQRVSGIPFRAFTYYHTADTATRSACRTKNQQDGICGYGKNADGVSCSMGRGACYDGSPSPVGFLLNGVFWSALVFAIFYFLRRILSKQRKALTAQPVGGDKIEPLEVEKPKGE